MAERKALLSAWNGGEMGGAHAPGGCPRWRGRSDDPHPLEPALSDTSKSGMAKSLFMGGREAGFDMGSKEGIEAWMRAMQSGPLPPS
jgi:hypothetical protein